MSGYINTVLWTYLNGFLRAAQRDPRPHRIPGASPVPPPPDPTPTFTRPTGTGYFPIESLGVGSDLRAAVAKVPAGGTLTLPAGTFTLPNFGMSGYGLVTASVGIVGSGPTTIITVAPNTAVAQASTPAIIRFGGGSQKIGQFTLQGSTQTIGGQKFDYVGMMLANQTSPHLFDVLVRWNNGSLNSPVTRTIGGVSVSGQGETFAINLFRCNDGLYERVETDGRDLNGVKQSGSGVGVNNCNRSTFRDCHLHHSGNGHGLAIYRCEDVATYDMWSHDNGQTGGTATNGSLGAGLNCEQSWNTRHFRAKLGANTLAPHRYYGNSTTAAGPPNGGGVNFGGDTSPHTVDSTTVTDGQPYKIRVDNEQTTAGLIFTNCPSVQYVIT